MLREKSVAMQLCCKKKPILAFKIGQLLLDLFYFLIFFKLLLLIFGGGFFPVNPFRFLGFRLFNPSSLPPFIMVTGRSAEYVEI